MTDPREPIQATVKAKKKFGGGSVQDLCAMQFTKCRFEGSDHPQGMEVVRFWPDKD